MNTRLRPFQSGLLTVALGAVVALMLALTALYWSRPLLVLDVYEMLCRWHAGLERRTLEVDGDRWAYDERGSGTPTLVLVHGFAGSRSDWYPWLDALPRQGHLVIVDLPGWGASSRRTNGDYRARTQARRLASFLDAIDARDVQLIGHSMGGKISGITAARYPERIARLTLIAPSGLHFQANDFARRILAGENPFNIGDRAGFERLLHDAFEQPPWLPGRVVDALIAANAREHAFNDHMLDVLRRGEHRYSLEPALPHLAMPVQVLWCRPDRILDVSSLDTLRRLLPTARVDVIEQGCGHMPMVEVPATLGSLTEFETAADTAL